MTGKGILIVEDENIVALDMKMRLEALGYAVAGVVDTGPAALEAMVASPPDLVLMDIKLKGEVDGIETARIARERVEVPIIFVTAFTDEKTLERAKLASPYGYIVKPFHERELRIAIELALYKFQFELSMRRAKELAEETSRLKGEFLANVSHELKTPLNSVIGFTELALDRAVDDEQREYLGSAIRSAKSLSTLIDSILDFARLESGRSTPNPVAFSLDELLGSCVDLLAVGAFSKGLEVTFRRDPELPDALVGDSGRLRQALMNLIDNAVKFTDRGAVRLVAELAEGGGHQGETSLVRGSLVGAEGKGILLRLVVEDSGVGMPEDRIAAAFERFTQLDGSKTRSAGGTGLGLAIVDKSVEILGGSIAVRSSRGKGTRIEMLIPLSPAPAAEPVSDPEKPAEPAFSLSGRTVAAVGFSGEAAADLAEILRRLGGRSLPASSLGACAMGQRPDFIVADERAVRAEPEAAALLAGRLVICLRFGGASRVPASLEGAARLPLPVRGRPLLASLAALERRGSAGAETPWPPRSATARKPAPKGLPRSAPAAAVALLADEPARGSVEEGPSGRPEPGLAQPSRRFGEAAIPEGDFEDLGRFMRCLEQSLEHDDLQQAERDAKDYRELFLSRKGEACERLAFSALLLARKGDGEGLRGLIERLRRILSD
ncbi:MAG: response regulator [Spirochaetaceae bacterium]|nr:response regulator [Spirochaetaceae bacterium]